MQFMIFAFDRSKRNIDQDGRLHVASSHISKEMVCDYLGSEIPADGLDANKVYRLYRPGTELLKAAKSFNNLPILSKHVPVSADNHNPEIIIGSTGTDGEFLEPYLDNSLVIWEQGAIDRIESDQQREISCAYRYTVDMTSGTFDNVKYDGIMKNIIGNHIAIVEAGRAGADVLVSDSKINEVKTMDEELKKMLSAITQRLDALEKLEAEEQADEDPANEAEESNKEEPVKPKEPVEEPVDPKKMAQDIELKLSKKYKAIRIAEKEVQPLVGEVVAMDSAEDIYKFALDAEKIDITDMPESAYRSIVKFMVSHKPVKPVVAMDTASLSDEFSKMFPTAKLPRRA